MCALARDYRETQRLMQAGGEGTGDRKKKPHTRGGVRGDSTLWSLLSAGVGVKLLGVGDDDIRLAPFVWGVSFLE